MSGGGGSRRRSRRGRRGTHLLDAVTDRRELCARQPSREPALAEREEGGWVRGAAFTVGEVLTAGVRGVEVALDDEGEATAHDTVAVLAAQASLHARDALCKRKESTVSARGGGAGWRAASAPYGTRCIRRTSKRTSSHSTTVPSIWKKGRPTDVCQFWGLLRIRLLSVSRLPSDTTRVSGGKARCGQGAGRTSWCSGPDMRLGSGLRTGETSA